MGRRMRTRSLTSCKFIVGFGCFGCAKEFDRDPSSRQTRVIPPEVDIMLAASMDRTAQKASEPPKPERQTQK